MKRIKNVNRIMQNKSTNLSLGLYSCYNKAKEIQLFLKMRDLLFCYIGENYRYCILRYNRVLLKKVTARKVG